MSEGIGQAGEISFEDFLKVRMVTGTIVGARDNPKARIPAYIIEVDLGPYGRKTSSAQLTGNYISRRSSSDRTPAARLSRSTFRM